MSAFGKAMITATGSTTSRSLEDRFAEVKNVLDFGADPTQTADSWAAIQAAINWTSGPNRGVIFFPPGNYRVTQPLLFDYNGDLSIVFAGTAGSNIVAQPGFDDFLFKRTLGTPNNTRGGRHFDKLQIQNPGGIAGKGGCIQMGSTDGGSVIDCRFGGYIGVTTEDSPGVSSQNIHLENNQFSALGTVAGSHAAIVGGGGAIIVCDVNSADTAFRFYGKGFHAAGCRTELCNTAWLAGLDSAGTDQGASGFSLQSITCEGDGTAYWLAGTCSGFQLNSVGVQGHDSSNSGYPLLTTNSQYGIRVGPNCSAGVINSCGASSFFDQAGIAIASAASRAGVVLISTSALQTGSVSGVSWSLPSNAYTADWINCNISPVWAFSQLPTGGNVFEGDEYNITDSPTATWGANVTVGGGANRVLVRWNGAHWTVVGI